MSVSIIPTRTPSAASRAVTLAVVLDLPVPPRNEWMETIFDIYLLLLCPRLGVCRGGAPHRQHGDVVELSGAGHVLAQVGLDAGQQRCRRRIGLIEQGQQSLLCEEVVVRVFRVGYAVGVDQQCLARFKL